MCPLSKTDLAQLRKSIALARELEPDLEAAVKAGVPDCEEVVARHQHLKTALHQLLETYEPIVRAERG